MSGAKENIKFLVSDAPDVPPEKARAVAGRLFGIAGSVTPLESDRDSSFLLADGERRWVLKFFHNDEDPAVIDFQSQALAHVARTDPGLRIPEVVATRRGRSRGRIALADGRRSIVRLLSWVPGVVLSEAPESWRLRRSTGALVARLDRALQGFFHPGARHTLLWDIRQAPALRLHTGALRARHDRVLVELAIDRFVEDALPRCARLRSQVIHNDANGANLVASADAPDVPDGVIDFGDMIFAPLAMELAMACDAFGIGARRPLERFADVALGYDSVLALRAEEVDVLFDMIAARLALGAVIVARRAASPRRGPPYMPGYVDAAVETIARMQETGRDAATAFLRDALRFPSRGPRGTVATPESEDLAPQLRRRHAYLGRTLSLFYDRPLRVERGEGAILYDANGRAFVDAYNNVASVGHCHPHVVNAIARQAAALGTNTRYVYRVLADYAERLQATMPRHLRCCVMVNSGSEANDVALRMARLLTGRRGAIVMEHAYHGITGDVADLSPEGARATAPHVRTLMAPDPYRGPYRRGERDLAGRYAADADRALGELEEAGFGTACFMVDTSLCSNGIPDVPGRYLSRVASKVRAAGGMIVADEVQFGFGRPGTHMWGFQYRGMKPDIVTIGKPVGGGFPLGVVVTTPAILEAFGRATGLFSTFGGNPVACAAGLAVLDVLEREELLANARETGAYLASGLAGLKERHAMIGDVRGHGFIVGVEIVKDRAARQPDPRGTAAVLNRMRELGVLVGREGPHDNVFKIRPPMVFSRGNADTLVAAMDRAMSDLRG